MNFEGIAPLYEEGFFTNDNLELFVETGYITQADYDKLTGSDNIANSNSSAAPVSSAVSSNNSSSFTPAD